MINITAKIINKLKRKITLLVEILRKKKTFEKDKNYEFNFINIEKCFENRVLLSSNDSQFLIKIAEIYIKASNDLELHSEVFRPSNEWLPIYRYNLRKIINALKECNIDAIDSMYRNFWRDDCSAGLIGMPLNMQRAYFKPRRKIGYLSKSYYLNDSIHRFNLWSKLIGEKYPIESLVSPQIGNPYGYYIDGIFIKAGADYQHYYAAKIIEYIGRNSGGRNVVAEIGGGFGGMAYYLIRDSINTTYIDFDLPENLALTSYYLSKAFPEKKILLYGEVDLTVANLAEYDIVLMPSFELDKLGYGTCDLVFNSYSLAEMSQATISHYVQQAGKLIKQDGWFYHVNHTKDSLVSARNFPIPSDFTLVSEAFAAWNFGRNSNMDEYEFLYKKTGEI